MVATRERDTEQTTGARNRAAEALETARERTVSAYEAARERTSDVTREVTTQLSIYPVGAVIGGLAFGALIGVLLPRSKRESEWFGDTGRRLVDAGREAAQKGFDAGKDRVERLTGQVVSKVSSAVVEAVGEKD
jgi:ElaB/YqjD/DUF883 family membrane-anchored ribosome-binding protein